MEETAEALQIPEETVKTRLFRARRRLQKELDPELCGALSETFPFAGADCEAMTERVLTKFCRAANYLTGIIGRCRLPLGDEHVRFLALFGRPICSDEGPVIGGKADMTPTGSYVGS